MRLHVLLAEDDAAKRTAVLSLLADCGVDLDHVVQANDLRSTARELGTSRFDVLILDIAMPTDPGREVQPDAGLDLLRDLHEGDGLLVPRAVVGLSGYEDILERAGEEFATAGCVFVQYDSGDASWKAPIRGVITGARKGLSAGNERYRSHAFILCALPDPELSAVLSNGWPWNPHVVLGDNSQYHRAELTGERQVFAAAATRMGTEATVALALKAIEHFRPQYLVMTGIAAGVEGKANIGDVLVGDPVWNWGSGKWLVKDDEREFAPDPHHLPLDPALRSRVTSLAGNAGWLATMKAAFRGDRPPWEQKVLVGPLASGPAVLADGETIDDVVRQHRKLLGIDMEAYGVFVAANEATSKRPTSFVAKAVVDHANAKKGDHFQSYGAYASAAVASKLLEDLE